MYCHVGWFDCILSKINDDDDDDDELKTATAQIFF